MYRCFRDCNEWSGVGISSWIVTSPSGSLYSMEQCFQSCFKLGNNVHIDISDSHNGGGGTWDYSYCSSLEQALVNCTCLGINTNSSFKMDGCNLGNLNGSDETRNIFKNGFGNASNLPSGL